jgi:hypothetical protein
MDMLDAMLGGRGCSVDGTLTRNPITAMADRVFESHLALSSQPASDMGQQAFGEEHGFFIDGQGTSAAFTAEVLCTVSATKSKPAHILKITRLPNKIT